MFFYVLSFWHTVWHTLLEVGIPFHHIRTMPKQRTGNNGHHRRTQEQIGHPISCSSHQKRGGKVDLSVSSTFARKTSAKAWIKRIEKDYGAGALKNKSSQVTVFGLVDRCVTFHRKTMGKNKRQVLNTIQKFPIAELEVSSLRTSDLVEFAEQVADGLHGEAPRSPATAANYLSHCGSAQMAKETRQPHRCKTVQS